MIVFTMSPRVFAIVAAVSALAGCTDMAPAPPPPEPVPPSAAAPAEDQAPRQPVNTFVLRNHFGSDLVTFTTLTPTGGWSANWLQTIVTPGHEIDMNFMPKASDGCFRQFKVTAQNGRSWSGDGNLCSARSIDVRGGGTQVE